MGQCDADRIRSDQISGTGHAAQHSDLIWSGVLKWKCSKDRQADKQTVSVMHHKGLGMVNRYPCERGRVCGACVQTLGVDSLGVDSLGTSLGGSVTWFSLLITAAGAALAAFALASFRRFFLFS